MKLLHPHPPSAELHGFCYRLLPHHHGFDSWPAHFPVYLDLLLHCADQQEYHPDQSHSGHHVISLPHAQSVIREDHSYQHILPDNPMVYHNIHIPSENIPIHHKDNRHRSTDHTIRNDKAKSIKTACPNQSSDTDSSHHTSSHRKRDRKTGLTSKDDHKR